MRILLFLVITAFISCKSDVSSTQKEGLATAKNESPKAETKATKITTSPSSDQTTKPDSKTASKLELKKALKLESKNSVETNFNKNGIPDACDLLTQETIARYLDIPAASISLADGSSSKNDLQRACFFKWDGSEIKNAGVMVQVQQNPVAEDVPDYLTFMVESLKTQGENDMVGGTTKFQDWEGFGDDGAYSTTVGKYVWRVGNDWAFMIAFNTTLTPKQQKKAAEAFHKEVMSRMTF